MLLNCGVGGDSWESLGLQGDQTSHSYGNQPQRSIGRTVAEAEVLIFWPPDAQSPFIWKDPDPGKDWRQKEKGTTEDEMAGWHHRLNGHELEQTPGESVGQKSLACYCPWGHKESDMTEQRHNNFYFKTCFSWVQGPKNFARHIATYSDSICVRMADDGTFHLKVIFTKHQSHFRVTG